MQDIANYPENGVAARYKRLEISVRQGQKLKTAIAEQGLVEEIVERTKYGRTLVIRLTEKGRQLHEEQTLESGTG